MKSLNSRLLRPTIALFAFSLLVILFQNCELKKGSDSLKDKSSIGSGEVSTGNGEGYGGKPTIKGPNQVNPGQIFTIQIEDGVPPFELESSDPNVSLKKIDEREYQVTAPQNPQNGGFELTVKDSALQESSKTILYISGATGFRYESAHSIATTDSLIYFFENFTNKVYVHKHDGEFVALLSASGDYYKPFAKESLLKIGPDGELYVMEVLTGRIHIFDSEHNFIRVINLSEKLNLPNSVPNSIAHSTENILILDAGRKSILALDKNWNLIQEFGNLGDSKLLNPNSIEIRRSDGLIFVADGKINYFNEAGLGRYGDAIRVYNPDFTYLTTITGDPNQNIEFYAPRNIRLLDNGEIIIQDYLSFHEYLEELDKEVKSLNENFEIQGDLLSGERYYYKLRFAAADDFEVTRIYERNSNGENESYSLDIFERLPDDTRVNTGQKLTRITSRQGFYTSGKLRCLDILNSNTLVDCRGKIVMRNLASGNYTKTLSHTPRDNGIPSVIRYGREESSVPTIGTSDKDGNIFVKINLNQVIGFDSLGQELFSRNIDHVGDTAYYNTIGGLATDESHLYVSDPNNASIKILDKKTGTIVSRFKTTNAEGKEIRGTSLTLDENHIYILGSDTTPEDRENQVRDSVFHIFKKTGEFIGSYGQRVSYAERNDPLLENSVSGPLNIAVDSKLNRIYITTWDPGDLIVFDLQTKNKIMTKNLKIISFGIDIKESGEILLSDWMQGRIVELNKESLEIQAQLGTGGPRIGEFAKPEGISLSGDGSLLVVEKNNYRLQVIPLSYFYRTLIQ